MMGNRDKLKSGDEWDAVSGWGRRYLKYLDRPGVRRRIKNILRRRDRKAARQDLRKGQSE